MAPKRRARMAFALAPIALAVSYACSTYEGVGGGGGADATPGDASDAGPTNDAPSADAPPDGPWCAIHVPDASVCDDFDELGTFGGKWNGGQDHYHATLDVVDDTSARSPP